MRGQVDCYGRCPSLLAFYDYLRKVCVMSCAKLAVIGDVHSWWTDFDVHFFNASDYDALLFTGDLPRIVGGVRDARALSGLTKPAIVAPGNHDGATVQQFLGELKNWPALCEFGASGQATRMAEYRNALGPVQLGGYSRHPLILGERRVDCLVGRPHSMGGDRLYFRPYLRDHFGVDSLEQSAVRLRRLVDESGDDLIFLAHNGPSGLGDQADSLWGCDFRPEAGDFGDTDWREAIEYARQSGKRVWAVIGGHMHHHLKRRKLWRQWTLEQSGIRYVNAARVPRIFKRDGQVWHHHVGLTLSEHSVEVSEVRVNPETGDIQHLPPH